MKFYLRDLFWLTLVLALTLPHAVVALRRSEFIMCPCCSSVYELDTWTQELQ
jgi:hypothetical protein